MCCGKWAALHASHLNKCNQLKHTVISIFLGYMLRFIAHHTNEVNKELLFWEKDTTKTMTTLLTVIFTGKKTTCDIYKVSDTGMHDH